MVERYGRLELVITGEESFPNRRGVPAALRHWGLASSPQEVFWVITYDAMMNIRTIVEIARGGPAGVPVHFPSLYSAVLTSGCDRFRVAHNHPSGDVSPTEQDIATTIDIMEGANTLGLYFEDHHIMGPRGQHFSFAAHKLLIPAPYTGEIKGP